MKGDIFMVNKTTRYLFKFIIITSILLVSTSLYAAQPTDISNHWAQDYILNLVNNEIMESYEDGRFMPDQAITRGEFAVALAKQLNMVPDNNNYFNDINGYPGYPLINSLVNKDIVSGYPDDTFRPDKAITRAELVAIMVKSLGLTDNQVTIELDSNTTFEDIPESHWGLNHIKIADKLDLVNGDQNNHFNPDKTASRAEAAKVITKLSSLKSETGYITDIYPSSEKVSINSLNGERTVYNFNNETLVGRNNRFVRLEDIMKTDKVFIIADNYDTIKYAKAYGMVTEDDLATEVSTMTDGVFQPEEIKDLSNGNINMLRPKLQTAVKEQLTKQGLTNDEVTALMNTEWDELEDLSKVRLSEAIAIQTGLPLDITRSLIDGDWEKLRTYGQIEIIQRIVQEVLESDLIS